MPAEKMLNLYRPEQVATYENAAEAAAENLDQQDPPMGRSFAS